MPPKPPVVTHSKKVFNDIVRDVQSLALPLMDKKARKDFMDAKISALGGKLAKQDKCPLPYLLRRRQRRKDQMKEAKELEQHTGVKLHTTSCDNYKQLIKKKKQLENKKRNKEIKLF